MVIFFYSIIVVETMELNIPTQDKLSPHLWGKSAWEFMDSLVLTYPRENPPASKRDAAYNYFQSLTELLPCPDCRDHYKGFLARHSLFPALASRRSLLDFYFQLRSEIQARTTGRQSFRNAGELWSHILAKFQLVQPKAKQAVVAPFVQSQGVYRPGVRPGANLPAITTARASTTTFPTRSCNCGGAKH